MIRPASPISPAEIQVLVLLADGLRAKQIAARLNITPNTVCERIKRVRAHYRSRGIDAGTAVLLLRALIADGIVDPITRKDAA